MSESQTGIQGQVGPEFLRSQIEVGTKVCTSVQELREDLARLRAAVAEVADKHGTAPIAASTHPFASWREQLTTSRERYTTLERDMRTVMRRLVISGMHVHVGVSDNDLRIDLMNQTSYFLPHLLALSCSSPFWHGVDTGLKSYRKIVFKGPPRTGLPEQFASWSEYQRHINVLIETESIEDASKVWWDIRPSVRYPTLEMRVADICACFTCCFGAGPRTNGGAPTPTCWWTKTCGWPSGMVFQVPSLTSARASWCRIPTF